MSSILDIDLDYFNLIENPEHRLFDLLDWGDCPIDFVVEKHHKAYSRWKDRIKKGTLTQPSHILHVDECRICLISLNLLPFSSNMPL